MAAAPIGASMRLACVEPSGSAARCAARCPALRRPSALASCAPRSERYAAVAVARGLGAASSISTLTADHITWTRATATGGRSAIIEREYTCALHRTIIAAPWLIHLYRSLLAQCTPEQILWNLTTMGSLFGNGAITRASKITLS